MTIKFSCVGQSLIRVDTDVIAANSLKFLTAHFDLDEVWKDLAVTACFKYKNESIHILVDNGECTVPSAVIKAGEFRVSLIGIEGEKDDPTIRATSTEVRVRVESGPEIENVSNAEEPTPTVVEQLTAAVNKAVETAEAVRKDAAEGKFDGEDGKVDEDTVNKIIAQYLKDNEITGEVDPEEIKKIVEDYLAENSPEAGVDAAEVQKIIEDYLKANPPAVAETDPTVPAWAKSKTKPTYTAEEIGADSKGTAENKVSNHNISSTAHNDLRLAFQQLAVKLNNFLDSDDTTLDQLSEMIEYIKSNRALVEEITTKKVNVADIVNSLTSNETSKPLSAAQGAVLKGLIEKTLTDANKYTDDSLASFEEGYSVMYTQLLKGLYGDDVWQEFEQTGEFVSIVYLISESLKTHNTNEQAHSDIRALINDIATGKLDASKLTEAINTALAQAKASGEFDGATGRRGTGLLPITTAPSAYTTAVNGLTPAYRISLSTVKTQSSTTEVYAGDTIRQSYYHYPVIYVDASYVYCGTRVSIRGATGSAGKTPVKGTDYFTEDDKTEMVNAVISALPTTEGVGF